MTHGDNSDPQDEQSPRTISTIGKPGGIYMIEGYTDRGISDVGRCEEEARRRSYKQNLKEGSVVIISMAL